ncbi:MAG: extracellular solute-binding protein [Eubacterium sp.]
MKKKLLSLVLVTAMTATLFAGCTRKAVTNDDNQGNGEINTTDEITLTVWESEEVEDFIEQAGEAFTKEYPNINIKYVNVEIGDATSTIALDGPAGVGPDLFAVAHDNLGTLVEAGHIVATEDADTVIAETADVCNEALTYDGTLYGYPVSIETYALCYNKALISEDEVPTTWDDLIKLGKSWNKSDYLISFPVGQCYYGIPFTTYNGNRLYGPEGTDYSSTYLLTDDALKGMDTFKNLRNVLNVPSADLATSNAKSLFTQGKAAMFITGLWDVTAFESAGIDYAFTTMPSLLDEDKPITTFSGVRVMCVSRYSKYQAEAAAFADFLMTDEMQELRYELTGTIPATTSSIDKVAAEDPNVAVLIKQMEYTFPMPSNSNKDTFWASFNSAFANIWDGASVKSELQDAENTVLAE